MNVLVLGRKGLVGTHLVEALLRDRSVVAGLDIEDGGNVVDRTVLTCSISDLMNHNSWKRVDWVVNLAAMTAVDACQSDQEKARSANVDGAGHAALVAREIGATLLQVSTDYVFDGKSDHPYKEMDPKHPLSVYGQTKLDGEVRVGEVLPENRLLIVRGQSLYGRALKSFPDAIVRMAHERKPVRVVNDQIVSPTWASDFACGLVTLMKKGATGTFHLSSTGSCTWFEFATFVFKEWNIDPGILKPITAAELGRPATRPAWSVFDLTKFSTFSGTTPKDWRTQYSAYRATQGDYWVSKGNPS